MIVPIDYDILRIIWWGIMGILLCGFAVMDGFDMGVAMLLPLVGKTETDRRVILNTIGPVGREIKFGLSLALGQFLPLGLLFMQLLFLVFTWLCFLFYGLLFYALSGLNSAANFPTNIGASYGMYAYASVVMYLHSFLVLLLEMF